MPTTAKKSITKSTSPVGDNSPYVANKSLYVESSLTEEVEDYFEHLPSEMKLVINSGMVD